MLLQPCFKSTPRVSIFGNSWVSLITNCIYCQFDNKKKVRPERADFLFPDEMRSGLFAQFLQALGANVLALEIDHVMCIVTENAGRLILLQNDRIAVYVDFQSVALSDAHSAAQLDGQDDAAQLIYFSYDTGSFHCWVPSFISICIPVAGSFTMQTA